MMNKLLRGALCLLLTLCLLCALLPGSLAEDQQVIRIRSAEDLMSLAADCSLDTWSDGVRVILENDISLSGSGFEPIPIFNGSFDGRGYSIFDLDLSAAQSPCGLFLETGREASIQNLTVTGAVLPHGDDSMVGGLVGLNRGLITNCAFQGQIAAVHEVGGIAGKNEATGVISLCSSSGTVSGLGSTGGIVGRNEGAVVGCENNSYVNTESVDPSLRLDEIDTSSILNFLRSFTTDNAGITTDTGGIAGENTGFLERCRNHGTVGYLHLGYNVGGIAGRSGGYVNGCTNDGEVYGRKDAGGIVGQAEPLIEVTEAQNLLAGLGYRMYALNASIDRAIEDAGAYSDDLAAQLSELPAGLLPLAEAMRGLDWKDPDALSRFQSLMAGTVSSLSADLEGMMQSMDGSSATLMEDMQDISDNLGALSGAAMQALSLLSGAEETENILSDDSSGAESEAVVLGKVRGCVNEGSVYGDSDVGGIAGSISIENEQNPEQNLSEQENSLIQQRYSFRALIQQCINRGDVTAKRECVGGICGKMDLGYLTNCASYGPAALEDGDYAGGICGLSYGKIHACCTKCSISGKKYVGGILGNGFDGKGDTEKASLVSGCYALVDIREKPQFAGAISGGGDGVYENNYYVPAGYAGMDKLSIHGQAEPMDFADFEHVEGLPEECRSFTLRFVVEGETVKTLPFAYGDSFDRSVFPKVEKRDGAYAVWDRTDLSDLRFDTVVTASFRMNEAVLRSEELREDGRSVLYVDGQFQEGDALETETLSTDELELAEFRGSWQETIRQQLRSTFVSGEPDYSICVGFTERLRLRFPEDGQTEHTLRYLTPDGSTDNYRLYLRTAEGWERLKPDRFGSYLTFAVPGSEAEILLVSTIQSWWILAYIGGALLVLAALVFVLVRLIRKWRARPIKARPALNRKSFRSWLKAHKKALRIGIPAVLAAGLLVFVLLKSNTLRDTLATYRLLKNFSEEETDILTDLSIHSDEREIEIETTVHRVSDGGKMINCAEQYGITLYIADGMVYLENGRTFEITGTRLDQSAVLELAREVFRSGDIQKEKLGAQTRYTAEIREDSAARILGLFLAGDYSGLIQAENLTTSMTEENGMLSELSFLGEGVTESGRHFTLQARFKPQEMTERPMIPQAVRTAMQNAKTESTELLTQDLLMLLAAWIKNDGAEEVDADIAVQADCGSLRLNDHYDYFRRNVGGTDIHCVGSRLFTVYFTDQAACTGGGTALSEAEVRIADAAKLISVARDLCLKGQFSSVTEGESCVFTIALTPEDAESIAQSVLPELKTLDIRYGDCSLCITVTDGSLSSVALSCGGSIKVVTRELEVSAHVLVRYEPAGEHTIPTAVQSTLIK